MAKFSAHALAVLGVSAKSTSALGAVPSARFAGYLFVAIVVEFVSCADE